MKKLHLTIVDDDRSFLDSFIPSIENEFEIRSFHNEAEAIEFVKRYPTDAVLLNVLETCRKIKRIKEDLPVFFFSHDDSLNSIRSVFESGGFDFYRKALSPFEIATRIKNRLMLHAQGAKLTQIICGDFLLDLKAGMAFQNNREIPLTRKEYDLLKLFCEHKDQLVSKQTIYDLLWADTNVHINNIDTHIFNLRRKIQSESVTLSTVKARGYILRATSTEDEVSLPLLKVSGGVQDQLLMDHLGLLPRSPAHNAH